MTNTQTQTAKTDTTTGVEDLDALLEGLDVADASPEAIEETIEEIEAATEEAAPVVEEVPDEIDDLDLGAAVAQIEREEVYAEQESTGDADADAAKQAKAEAPKTKKKAAGASTPRTPRDMNTVAAEFFVLEGDVATMSDADKDAAKTATIAAVPGQKKIAEKFENLFTSVSAGKAPSRYVVDAFKFLDDKGSITSTDLVAHYQAAGLGTGTARSQAGQIMNLFDTVKIATRSKQSLALNKGSVLAGRLRDILKSQA